MRYTGPREDSFRTVPFASVIKGIDVNPADFRDRVVIVGATAARALRTKITPFGDMPGMYSTPSSPRAHRAGLRPPAGARGDGRPPRRPRRPPLRLRHPRSPTWLDLVALSLIVAWWGCALLAFRWWLALLDVVAPCVLAAFVIVIVRFWQMFIRLHLTNLELTRSNRDLDERVNELETLRPPSRSSR
jgi:CHASE2 domain-containing sensor protein